MIFLSSVEGMGTANSAAFFVIIAVVVGIGLGIGLPFIPANIAKKKGRSAVGYWFFGFGAFLPALIVSIAISDLNSAAARKTVTPDELMKYKELLDRGVITQEEFEAKKQLLK